MDVVCVFSVDFVVSSTFKSGAFCDQSNARVCAWSFSSNGSASSPTKDFSDAKKSPSRVALQKIAVLKCASKRNAAHSRDVSIASSGKERGAPFPTLSFSLSSLFSCCEEIFLLIERRFFLYELCVKLSKNEIKWFE